MESLYERIKKKQQGQPVSPPGVRSGGNNLYDLLNTKIEEVRKNPPKEKPGSKNLYNPNNPDNQIGREKEPDGPVKTFFKSIVDPKTYKPSQVKDTFSKEGLKEASDYTFGTDFLGLRTQASELTEDQKIALERFKMDSMNTMQGKIDMAQKKSQELNASRPKAPRLFRWSDPNKEDNSILGRYVSGQEDADRVVANYKAAKRNYELMGTRKGTGFKGNFLDAVAAIKDDWKANPQGKIPFAGSAGNAIELFELKRAVTKQQNGGQLTDLEDSLIEKYKSQFAPVEQSFGSNVGSTVSNMPTFIAEFVLTTGVTKATQKAGMEALKKYTENAVAKAVTKTVTTGVGATLQSSVNVPEIAERTMKYTLPTYQLTTSPDGQKLILDIDKQGDSFDKAFYKAFGTNAVDYATEYAGELVEDPLVAMKNFVLSKYLAKHGVTNPSMLTQFKNTINWNGIIGEVFEEELAESIQAPMEERPYNAPGLTLEGGERFGQEAVAIGALGGLGKITEGADFAQRTLREMMSGGEKPPTGPSGSQDEPLTGETLREQMAKHQVEAPETVSQGGGSVSLTLREEFARRNDGVQFRPVNQLVNLEEDQGVDRERVDYYKDRILQGDQVEPIIVVQEKDGRITIEDGKHRAVAHIELGIDNAPTVLRQEKVEAKRPEPIKTAEDKAVQAYIDKGIEKAVAKLFVEFDNAKVAGSYPINPAVEEVLADVKTVKAKTNKPYLAAFDETENEIENVNAGRSDLFHEKVHAYVANTPEFESFYERFQQDFDFLKKNSRQIQLIDEILKKDKNYSKLSEKDRTEERYAYVAEMFGGKGIKSIPKLLQKHYKKLFGEEVKAKAEPKKGLQMAPSEEKADEKSKPLMTKAKMKTLAENNAEFKAKPVLTVDAEKNLTFDGKTTSFKIKASALGLIEDNLQVGDKIEVNLDSLKGKSSQQLRVTKDGSAYASTGGQKIDTFETVSAERGTEVFKLFEKVEGFIKKYAKMFGEGYLPRNARGVFYNDTSNILIDGKNSLSVAVHEVTHYIDKQMGIIKDLLASTKRGEAIRKELTDLYVTYYPGGKPFHKLERRMKEGYATLIQKYVEKPTLISEQYPMLVEQFIQPGGRYYHPVITEMVGDLRTIISGYQALSALEKVGSLVSNKNSEVTKEFLNFWDKFFTEIFDAVWPAEVLDKQAGQNMSAKAVNLRIRQLRNRDHIATNNILGERGMWMFQEGELKKVLSYNWGDLIKQVYKDKIHDDFAYYLIARDAHFQFERLDEMKAEIDNLVQQIEEAKALTFELSKIQELQEQLKDLISDRNALQGVVDTNPITREVADQAYAENKNRFVGYEQMFDQLTQAEADYMVDKSVQLITPETRAKWKSRKGYASNARSIYNEITGESDVTEGSIKVGGTKISSTIRRTGSQRAYLNPLYSHIRNHMEIMKKGMKQTVYNEVLKHWVPYHTELFQRQKLEVIFNPETQQAFYPQEKDPHYIMARENYKRVPILTDGDVIRMLDEVSTHQDVGRIGEISNGIARVFTRGTTATFIPFALQNIMVDQPTAFVNSQNDFTPIYSPLKTIGTMLSPQSEDYKYYIEYLQLGGELQTFARHLDEKSPDALLRHVAGEVNGLKEIAETIKNGSLSFVDALAAPSQKSEIATRAAEYIAARKAGKHQMVAMEQAGRVSAPFHHMGRLGHSAIATTWVRSMVFFNATLQVLAQQGLTLQTKKGQQKFAIAMATIVAGFGASMALMMLAASDEQKKQYKQLDPRMFARYIYFPKPNGKDLGRLRIPETMAIPGALINMVMNDVYNDTNYSANEYFETSTVFLPEQLHLWDGLNGVFRWMPQAAKPITLVAVNKKDFPNIHDLESMSVQKYPARYRTYESTPEWLKWLGREIGAPLGFSPIKLDYLITGYLSRSTYYLSRPEQAFNPLGAFNHYFYLESSRDLQYYYDTKKENDQAYTAWKNKATDPTKEEKEKINKIRTRTSKVDELMDEYKKIDLEKEPEKAAKKRDKIFNEIQKLRELE